MFKSASNSGSGQPVAEPASDLNQYDLGASQNPHHSRAVTETETLAREIKDGTLSGYVGNGTNIDGETSFKGMMRVDGHVSGNISSDDGTLIVGDGGRVDANLNVAVAMIRGTVNGEIIATQRIQLGRTARVTGNIQTSSLSIEEGAVFEGNCRMTAKAAAASGTKPDTKASSLKDKRDNGAFGAGPNTAVGDELIAKDSIPSVTNTTN
jgi:cytoskeletal protein CcmA (bactofilin family)